MKMSKKQSPIWEFFIVGEDIRLAKCDDCGEHISRGGKTTSTYNTMNLVYHLKTKHVDKFHDYPKLLEAAKETPSTKEKGLCLLQSNLY